MAEELLGRDVLIPANAWTPPLEADVPGYISKITVPSVRYPKGRYEVSPSLPGAKIKYMFPTDTFPTEWLLPTRLNAPSEAAKTPSKRAPRTPSSSGAEQATPGTKSRRRTSGAGPTAAGTQEAGPASQPTSPARQRRGRNASPGQSPGRSPGRARTPGGRQGIVRDPLRTPSGRRVTFKDPSPGRLAPVTTVPRLSAAQNFKNAVLMVAVAIPALLLGYAVCTADPGSAQLSQPVTWPLQDWQEVVTLQWWQRLGLHSPLLFVNLVVLLNVDVLFWVVALIQGTTWLIDPYWTFIPPLIGLFYELHPLAQADPWRKIAATCLIRVWAIRLTHSYFRREEWQFGAREDWRFTDLSRQYGTHWWWLSFFLTYLTQHAMLVGISLPLYAVFTSSLTWGPLDALATLLAATGILTSWVADNQLAAFMARNRERREAGQPPILLLNTGLWFYSRHPNYFGEQLFWWGLSLFAVNLDVAWMVAGTAFNSACMIAVTGMTEARMTSRPERAALWKRYKATTSAWVPWFKGQDKTD